MKKTAYIQPQTSVVLLQASSHILAGSNEFTGEDVTLNPESMSGGDGGDAASRRSFWDDED